ncbi:MAG: hypothetical protein LIO92_11825 [Clostridiales bacterium]|nr:hypothetical protein [Clostridiales bacterium]
MESNNQKNFKDLKTIHEDVYKEFEKDPATLIRNLKKEISDYIGNDKDFLELCRYNYSNLTNPEIVSLTSGLILFIISLILGNINGGIDLLGLMGVVVLLFAEFVLIFGTLSGYNRRKMILFVLELIEQEMGTK